MRAYIIYKTAGYYQETFGTHSLRVLTVTTLERRLRNLKRTTERAEGRSLFWFTTFEALSSEKITLPMWYVAGQTGATALFDAGQ